MTQRRLQFCRAVAPTGGLRDGVDLIAFRGLTGANVPIGRCLCGGHLYGVDATEPRRPGERWTFGLRCDACRYEPVCLAHLYVIAADDEEPGPAMLPTLAPVAPAARQLALPLAMVG